MNAVSPVAPLPSAPPVAPPPAGGEPDSEFSNALARAKQARQGDRQAEKQLERQAERQREARATAQGAATPAAASQPQQAEAAGTRQAAGTTDADSATDAPDTQASHGQTADTGTQATDDAALPPWLDSMLGRRPSTPETSSQAGQDGPAQADLRQGEAVDVGGAGVSTQAREALTSAQTRFMQSEASGPGADNTDAAEGRHRQPGAQALSAADPSASAPGTPAGALSPGAPGATGLSSASVANPAGVTDVPARHIHAPVHSPGFAPALGAQLNLMVRDGVTEARLNLNPAEMGPISVQIRIEGQHARVEMAAEMAGTRQALEQAMPALASALRDSGLTLTGGGVFEQARDTRQAGADGEPGRDGRGGPGTEGQADPAESEAGRPASAATPRGVVDLYA